MQSLYFELFHIFKPHNANLKKVIYFIIIISFARNNSWREINKNICVVCLGAVKQWLIGKMFLIY